MKSETEKAGLDGRDLLFEHRKNVLGYTRVLRGATPIPAQNHP